MNFYLHDFVTDDTMLQHLLNIYTKALFVGLYTNGAAFFFLSLKSM